MSSDRIDYPPEMAHLDPATRERAARLARQLADEGYPEKEANRMAIRRMTSEERDTSGGQVAPTDPEKYVTPHEEGWAVVSPTGEHQTSIYASREEAMRKAHELARKEHSRVHVQDGNEHVEEPDNES